MQVILGTLWCPGGISRWYFKTELLPCAVGDRKGRVGYKYSQWRWICVYPDTQLHGATTQAGRQHESRVTQMLRGHIMTFLTGTDAGTHCKNLCCLEDFLFIEL